jgi:hypothetical protein
MDCRWPALYQVHVDELYGRISNGNIPKILRKTATLLPRTCRWKWLNSATYSFIFWALWQQESARINAWRTSSLGLPPLMRGPAAVLAAAHTLGADIPVVMMCSSHVVPGLKPPADWPANCHLTGFAFSPAATAEADVEPRLREFVLQGGGAGGEQQQQQGSEASAPLYLGFGSMPAPDPKALLELAVQVGCASSTCERLMTHSFRCTGITFDGEVLKAGNMRNACARLGCCRW